MSMYPLYFAFKLPYISKYLVELRGKCLAGVKHIVSFERETYTFRRVILKLWGANVMVLSHAISAGWRV